MHGLICPVKRKPAINLKYGLFLGFIFNQGAKSGFNPLIWPKTAYETFEPWVQSRTGNSLAQGATQSNLRDIALQART